MIALPSRLDPRWRDVAVGKLGGNWHMLAVKLMMQRIRSEMQADPSPGNITKCAGAVHDFFEKNQKWKANGATPLHLGAGLAVLGMLFLLLHYG